MRSTNRRQFIGGVGALAAAGAFPLPAFAQAKPRLVVIGGGPGGATVAKYVAKDRRRIDVTLIEPAKQFTTCFHSNLYLGGFRPWESITHKYDKLAKHGVKLVHEPARAIDRDKKTVRSRAAQRSPTIALWSRPASTSSSTRCPAIRKRPARSMPHAWKPGPADPAPGEAAQRAQGRRHHRHDRAAEPVPLPARPLRARLDDGACAENQGSQEVAHRHHRPEGELLQAGPLRRGLAEALPRHGRVAGPEDARRHQERRSPRP